MRGRVVPSQCRIQWSVPRGCRCVALQLSALGALRSLSALLLPLCALLALGDDGLQGHDDPVRHAPLILHRGALDRLVQAGGDPDRQPVVAWLLALRHVRECHAKAVGPPTYRHSNLLCCGPTYKVRTNDVR